MEHLLEAVEQSLVQHNWYAALSLALTLPDICAKMELPEEKGSAKRYSDWANKYFTPKYTTAMGSERIEHIFLSGNDLYALRCAVLHEGSDIIIEQRARESLDKFHLIAPPESGMLHCNQLGSMLQLQVDYLCKDVCQSVREWVAQLDPSSDVHDKIQGLMRIHEFDPSEGIKF